jgi:D-glycero-D-manno-heptose 1,7-bisphosphate phosphatase
MATSETTATRPAVFLDRDGVVNPMIYYPDHGIVDSPFTLEQFCVLPKVPQAVRLLNDLGLVIVVISNQPGIAKGHFNASLLPEIEAKLQRVLKPADAHVDAFYYCLHHPDSLVPELRCFCDCRKPKAGLLLKAADELHLSLPDSYMIGDGLTDMEAGRRAGCQTIFVGRWKCEHCQIVRSPELHPSRIAGDLLEAALSIQHDLAASKQLSNMAQQMPIT